MNLRPHHLLCIQKFTGHGYDEAFTKHLAKIVTLLSDEPKTMITLTCGCDSVCELCPNHRNGTCLSAEKVLQMDNGVIEKCDLTYGATILWSELSRRTREKILESDQFEQICSSCQWHELCKSTEVSYERHIENT